jgi:WD40 repeat protein
MAPCASATPEHAFAAPNNSHLSQASCRCPQYAHDERFIHRDIKPENMLLNGRDEILLSDFGIATIAHSPRSLSTQEIMGTAVYMAPDQIQGKPHPASDQSAGASLTWSPDGTRIASGGDDKTVQIWDSATGKHITTYSRHTATVNAVAWSHSGKLIASASADKTVQVWDADTQAHAFSLLHRNPVNTVAWSSADKRIASASGNPFTSEEHSVQLWNATATHTTPILTYSSHTTMGRSAGLVAAR